MLTRAEMETRRLQGAEMLRGGVSQSSVARQLAVSREAVSRWHEAMGRGEGLESRKAPGRPCKLTGAQLLSVCSLWETRPRWTSPGFTEAIRVALGVTYDADHVWRLVVRLGLRTVRTRRLPEVSDEEMNRRAVEMCGCGVERPEQMTLGRRIVAKKAVPVRRGKRGGITLDLLAVDRAVREGTLSDSDKQTIELILPGIIERLTADQEKAAARG